ncbi:Heterochromatin-associated protein MENT [Hypsibius exemplaris]|uniref:Heterochromatin-associated protein MENT n=1 Tax=Hypsibius exemplaris TaxID=2072580 RepID=A0A9X6NLC7_HYPEX|nr:Heterochromatin-associated protein MENT [Hypsibius exemplaris]
MEYSSLLVIFLSLAALSSAQSNRNFSINLFNAVSETTNSDANIALSPFSADAALSMTYAGAAGTTRSELASVLGLERNSNAISERGQIFKSINSNGQNYALNSANGIFIEQTYEIVSQFRAIVTDAFEANVSSVDFIGHPDQATADINAYVVANTKGKIQELFAPGSLTSDSRLVLVNAIYFKADWQVKFNEADTKLQPFTLSNGQQVQAPLMNVLDSFSYTESAELGGAQVLELSYKDGQTSFVAILPKKEIGLKGLNGLLTASTIQAALGSLSHQKVNVTLPKFEISAEYGLVPALQATGIKAAFTDSADFSGISRKRDLKISKVVQKVFVEVNENGTEAAAATGVQIVLLSLPLNPPPPPVIFRADRPFLYLIRHKATDSLLFIGRVADPTLKQ